MRRLVPLLAILFLVAAACSVDTGAGGDQPVEPPTSTDVPATETLPVSTSRPESEDEPVLSDPSGEREEPLGPSSDFGPPDLVLTGDTGDSITLSAVSFCWSGDGQGLCADGFPQEPFPILVAERSFTLQWPVDGWIWSVTSASGTGFCDPTQQVSGVVARDMIAVPGGARIDVFGRGPEGDAWFVFASELADPVGALPLEVRFDWTLADGGAPGLLSVNIANLETEPGIVGVVAVVGSGDISVEIPLRVEWTVDCWTGSIGGFGEVGGLLDGLTPPFVVRLTVSIDDQRLISDPVLWPDDFADNSDEGVPITMTER